MSGKVKDPVCGMEFNEGKAKATLYHEGKTYYFCSPGCREKFQQKPDRYLSGSRIR